MREHPGSSIEQSADAAASERDFERSSEGMLVLAGISAASGAFVGFCFAGDIEGALFWVLAGLFGALVGWWSRGLM